MGEIYAMFFENEEDRDGFIRENEGLYDIVKVDTV